MSDLKKVNEEITEDITSAFKKIEDGVIGGYKKIESSFNVCIACAKLRRFHQ